MNSHVEDFSTWDVGALVTVPPESLEYSDLVGLVIELQSRLYSTEEQSTLRELARNYRGGY